MRQNADQKNSEYGHFSRSGNEKILSNFEMRKKSNKEENLNNLFLLANFNQQLWRTIYFLPSGQRN